MASRSPVTGVGYDQSLLAAAPEVTKADKQEGYNPDLLEQGTPSRAPTSRRTPVTLPTTNGYNGNGSDESNGARKAAVAPVGTAPLSGKDGKPRSRKLMWIIIGVVVLVIIAVAVGVGVGVGAKKGNNNNLNGGNGNNGGNLPGGPTSPVSSISPTKTDSTTQTATDSGADQGGVKPSGIATTDINGGESSVISRTARFGTDAVVLDAAATDKL